MFVLISGWVFGQSAVATASIISVQTGDHSEFVRISLSWPQLVNFQYNVTTGGFEIRFFYKTELLLDRLNKFFPGSYYKHEGDQTILSLKVSPKRKFEAKSYGNITYLDVYKTEVAGASVMVPAPPRTFNTSISEKSATTNKPSEVDLTKLFKKVAEYLDDVGGEVESTVSIFGENGILLKYPDTPIAVYEIENTLHVVVLKKETPTFDKKVEEKYKIQHSNLNEGFVLDLPKQKLQNVIVSKNKEGWQIEFSSSLAERNTPRFLVRDEGGKGRFSRTGLFDPIDVNGVLVCCTLDPAVFVPLQMELPNMQMFASSIGAAFKVDSPQNIVLDRDFITFSPIIPEGELPLEKSNKIKFHLDGATSFIEEKVRLVEAIVGGDNGSSDKWLELILLYLANGFSSEADSEIVAMRHQYPEFDIEKMMLLRAVAALVEGVRNQALLEQLFDIHKKSLESFAWYAFLQSQINGDKIPIYLGEYLADSIGSFPDPLKSILSLALSDRLILQQEANLSKKALVNVSDRYLSADLILLKQFLQLQIKKAQNEEVDLFAMDRLLRQVRNPVLMARIIVGGNIVDWKSNGHQRFIDMLDSLLPLLEGSIAHVKAIEYLLDYHVTMKNYLEVLNKAALLQKKYPQSYQKIKPNIYHILYYIVCEKGFEKVGLVYTLQILNQFVDAVPTNAYATDFILELTEKLHRIGLIKESIRLLENYMGRKDLKLKPNKREELLLQLLELYVSDGDEEKANRLIKVIEQQKDLGEVKIQTVQVLKAKLAALHNQSDKVLGLLQDNHLLSSLKIKAAVLWEQQNWSGVADVISEIIDKHSDQLDEERKERYVVHLAAALVLNESKYRSKGMGRQKTKLTLQQAVRTYEKILEKYKTLFQELTTEPHNSLQDILTRKIISDELQETDRMEKLFDQVKAIPTH